MKLDGEKKEEQKTPPQHRKEKNGQGNMLELAERIEQHYTSPSPAATIHTPAFFPGSLDHGILWGLFLGALLGILFSWLLRNGTVTPEGWEGLFSLGPFTFYAYWTFAGAALGLLVGGVISIMLTPAPISQEKTAQTERFVAGAEEQVVMVEVKE